MHFVKQISLIRELLKTVIRDHTAVYMIYAMLRRCTLLSISSIVPS